MDETRLLNLTIRTSKELVIAKDNHRKANSKLLLCLLWNITTDKPEIDEVYVTSEVVEGHHEQYDFTFINSGKPIQDYETLEYETGLCDFDPEVVYEVFKGYDAALTKLEIANRAIAEGMTQ